MGIRLVLASVMIVTAAAYGADAAPTLCECVAQASGQLDAKTWTPVGADCKALFLKDPDLKSLATQKTVPPEPQRAKLLKVLKGKQCPPPVAPPEAVIPAKPEVPSLDAQFSDLKSTTEKSLEKLQNQIVPLERSQSLLQIVAVISLFGLAGLLVWNVLQTFAKKPDAFASRADIEGLRTSVNNVKQTAENAVKQQADLMNALAQLSSQISNLKAQRDRTEGAGPATASPKEGRGASTPSIAANQMGTSMESSNVGPATGSSSTARLIAAYNAAARSQRTSDYRGFETSAKGVAFFSLANARERTQNRDLAPVFRTFETGTYCAVQTEDGTYAVFPTLGKFPWGLRRDAAMNLVFRFPDEAGEPDLGVSQAASFRRDGDEWTLLSMGALERL